MSTRLLTKNTEERNHHEKRITPNGTLFEFLASPDEVGAEICLIRATMPPGAAVPLHSHPDVELFYVLEGQVEAFQPSDGSPRWTTVGTGDTVTIPGNTKHAFRNSSPLPATMVLVTTSKLYKFFHAVTNPFDPDQSSTPPTLKGIPEVFRAAARFGYWMGSPEENAAIGLLNGLQKSVPALSEQKPLRVFGNPKSEVDQRALQQAAVLGRINLVNVLTSK